MKLPERIPRRLREAASVLPDFDEGQGAWGKDDAVEVSKSLRGTTVAISDVVLFEKLPWGFEASEPTLEIDRLPNEGDTDYGHRSRESALAFIAQSETAVDTCLVALTFPMWKDAA